MKLNLLAKQAKARLNLNNNYKHLISGATLFIILGAFFYPQGILSKQQPTTNTDKLLNIFNTTEKKIIISNKQSKLKPTINIQKINTLNISKLKKSKTTENNNYDSSNDNLKNKLNDILTGTPMENMIEPISHQDKLVAAFLVGIALKESQFGKHSPRLNGKDCYNYWGYRGKRARMGTGGHTCFDSPEDAVNTVAKRIKTLAVTQRRNTPSKMTIWKCGNSCANHSPASVSKWISDVSIYFNKINNS